jgi:regulator of sigma D
MTVNKNKLVSGGRKDLKAKESGRVWNMNTLYQPTFCQELINMMSRGLSIYEVAKNLGVGTRTLSNWSEQFPEFKAAMEDGKDYRRAWLDRGFRDYMEEKFDIRGYTVALTADYGYNDKAPQINFDLRNKEEDEAMKTVSNIIEDLHKTTI